MLKAKWKRFTIRFLLSLIFILSVGVIIYSFNTSLPDQSYLSLLINNIYYIFRFILAVLLFLTAIFCLGVFLKEKKEVSVIGLIISGILCCFSYPGTSLTKARQNNAIVSEIPSSKKELEIIKASIKKLEQDVFHKLIPLRNKYQKENNAYLSKIEQILPLYKANSYEELLRINGKNLEIINLIKRAAILQKSINLFNEKIDKNKNLLEKLETEAWKIEKKQDIKDLSILEEKKIEELIDITIAINKNSSTLLEEQDLGIIEESIFNKFNK